VSTWFRETKQRDILKVRAIVLRYKIERFPKVTRRRDVVATQRHDELPKHHQVFLDLLCRYGRPMHGWRGRVIREHVGNPARADPHAVLARDDDFGDVDHSHW